MHITLSNQFQPPNYARKFQWYYIEQINCKRNLLSQSKFEQISSCIGVHGNMQYYLAQNIWT